MLGVGIGENFHYAVYGLSFVIAFLALFYRNEIGIIFLVSLFPIYSVLSKALNSELPFANSITDMIIIAMLLGWMIQSKNTQEEPIGRSPMNIPFFFLIGYTFFSILLSTSPFGGFLSEMNIARFAHWKNYMIMPVLYVIVYHNVRNRRWKYAVFLLLSASLLVADFKFRQSFKWVRHTHYMDDSRVGGTLGFLGPNEWGSFHAIYTLFFIGLFIVDKHVKRRLLYLLLILGGAYSLMYSFSRGAYAGLLAGIVCIAFFRTRKLLLLLLVFSLFWKSLLPLSVVERVEGTIVEDGSRSDVVSIGGTELATAGRTEIWNEALKHFFENPVIGKGYNTYQRSTGWDTHNVYLKTMAEQGLIGLLIFLWLYFLALKSGWRLYKQADEELLRAFGFGFLCAVIGSMVVNFFGDRWTYLQIGGIYWVLWALVDQENSRIALKRQEEGSRLGAGAMEAIGAEGSVAGERVQGSKGSSELAQYI